MDAFMRVVNWNGECSAYERDRLYDKKVHEMSGDDEINIVRLLPGGLLRCEH